MKAIVKNPGEKPTTTTLDGDSLKALQTLVGGYITVVWHELLDENGITAWANDEGLLIGQEPNLMVYGQPIVGPVVFTGHNDEGETVALTAAQEAIVAQFLDGVTLGEARRAALALRLAGLF